MDFIKSFIDFLSAPTISFTLLTVTFPFIFPPTDWFEAKNRQWGIYKLWSNKGGLCIFTVITLFFIVGYFDPYFNLTMTKPDNIPIIILIYSMFLAVWYGMKKAFLNDERLDRGEKPEEWNDPDDKVLVWPDLVYIELIALIIMMVGLIVWSILIGAPLEEPANPAATPNPSKAPWYFLGLQEMLVYFDPWIAGVIFPTLIIVGMMAIPYMDINKKGDGYYSFKERRVSIFIFMYGWLVLWVFLIIIGTFFRGPNWNFFGPFEWWDPHKLVPLTNVNLSEYVWLKLLNKGLPTNIMVREALGFLVVIGYMFIMPLLLAKTKLKHLLEYYGPVRYACLMFFGLSMFALPIKMYLRWMFNLKYIIAIPEWFFNI